jgi:hypothetical protein
MMYGTVGLAGVPVIAASLPYRKKRGEIDGHQCG